MRSELTRHGCGAYVLPTAEQVQRAFDEFEERHPPVERRDGYSIHEGMGAAWQVIITSDGLTTFIDPNVISSFAIRLHWHDHIAAVRERLLEGRRSECERWWNR